MRVVYTGPSPRRTVAGVVATRGEPVEVPDEIGRRLTDQVTWREHGSGDTLGHSPEDGDNSKRRARRRRN